MVHKKLARVEAKLEESQKLIDLLVSTQSNMSDELSTSRRDNRQLVLGVTSLLAKADTTVSHISHMGQEVITTFLWLNIHNFPVAEHTHVCRTSVLACARCCSPSPNPFLEVKYHVAAELAELAAPGFF